MSKRRIIKPQGCDRSPAIAGGLIGLAADLLRRPWPPMRPRSQRG